MTIKSTLLGAAALLLGMSASAETIAITHAKIATMGKDGVIQNGTILVKDGRIAAVGSGVAVPAGARTIDAGGHLVTPGLVATGTDLGATEVEGESTTVDANGATDSLSAAFDVSLGINPASMVIPPARMGGVTRAVVTPQISGRGGASKGEKLFAGQAAVIDLSGDPHSITARHVAVMVDVGSAAAAHLGGSHASVLQALEADLEEAASYGANKSGYEHGTHRPYHMSREDMEALQPVISGKEPLVVGVHRVADIRRVIELGKRLKLKLILDGVEEGWLIAGEIAASGYPALVDPQYDLPESFEQLNARFENAGILAAAGVRLAIEPPHSGDYARQVRYNAGYAVAHGMKWEAAMEALTHGPAVIFGFAEKEGSIEPGLEADLVVWSGDPLEMLTLPEHVVIKGVEVPLTSRAQALARRYATPDAAVPPTYRH